DDAAAYFFEALKREIELIAAVASPRAEYVAGETGGVQAHQNWFGEIGLADNDRDRTAAHRVTENDEVGARTGIKRHRGFTGDRKRSDGFVAKTCNCFGLDGDDVVVDRTSRHDIGNQYRRQALR